MRADAGERCIGDATRLAADVHGRRHFGRVWVVWAMAAAEAIVVHFAADEI